MGRLGRRRVPHEVAAVRDVLPARAVAVLIYLAAPKTPLTFYLFAAVLGFTWLATVPPTAGLIGKLFGVRYLATLFGLATFTHQIGGFFGASLGGIALTRFGDFSWMWYADMALAMLAAFVNLPIREARARACPTRAIATLPVLANGAADPSCSDNGVSPHCRISPATGRTARAVRETPRASSARGRHAQVIAQHALHDGAQIARGLEIATLEQVRAREARPVGDHAPAVHGAA